MPHQSSVATMTFSDASVFDLAAHVAHQMIVLLGFICSFIFQTTKMCFFILSMPLLPSTPSPSVTTFLDNDERAVKSSPAVAHSSTASIEEPVKYHHAAISTTPLKISSMAASYKYEPTPPVFNSTMAASYKYEPITPWFNMTVGGATKDDVIFKHHHNHQASSISTHPRQGLPVPRVNLSQTASIIRPSVIPSRRQAFALLRNLRIDVDNDVPPVSLSSPAQSLPFRRNIVVPPSIITSPSYLNHNETTFSMDQPKIQATDGRMVQAIDEYSPMGVGMALASAMDVDSVIDEDELMDQAMDDYSPMGVGMASHSLWTDVASAMDVDSVIDEDELMDQAMDDYSPMGVGMASHSLWTDAASAMDVDYVIDEDELMDQAMDEC